MAKKMLHTKAIVARDIDSSVEDGVIEAVVGSTNVIDRMGDIIDQEGWDLNNYLKNPVILWGHNVSEERPPIGKALKVWLEGKQQRTKKLMFRVKFDLSDSFAFEIYRKVKEGFINTVSVGFIPVEWEDGNGEKMSMGRKYTKQELLELSFVPVPANPEAVIALRSMSKKDERFSPIELKDLYSKEDKKVEDKEEVEKEKEIKEKKEVEKEEKKLEKKEEKEVVEEKEKEVVEEKERELKDEEKITQDSKEVEKEEVEEVEDKEVKEEVKEVEEKKEKIEEEKDVKEVKKETKEVKEDDVKEKETKEKQIAKGVIKYKDLGILPESEVWDGPGEKAKADVKDLKKICTWYNEKESDKKSSYKLPHHRAEDHKCVWRGVAAGMASLLGARGGVSIPEEDRKGVYNHLKKHYEQFNKEAPDFKMVEEQVLANFDEEIQAVTLDREDKHVVKLVKKVIKKQRQTTYTSEQTRKALELIDLALSFYNKNSNKEVKS